jgi:hypothetical protein
MARSEYQMMEVQRRWGVGEVSLGFGGFFGGWFIHGFLYE